MSRKHTPTGPSIVDFSNMKDKSQIIDLSQVREMRNEEKRRDTQRVFFHKLLSVYSVAGRDSMLAIELVDVSENGLAFQIPFDTNRPWPAELTEFPIRLYFSQDSYLEVFVKIQNSRPAIEGKNRYVRVGCTVDSESSSFPAYLAFVQFLRLYSDSAKTDTDNLKIFFL